MAATRQRGDVLAFAVVLCFALPLVLPLILLRRPFTFRAFLCLVLIAGAVTVLVARPLVSGSLQHGALERRRDLLTVWALLGGSLVAIAFQKRTSDAALVRTLFDRWLATQSEGKNATVSLSQLALVLGWKRAAQTPEERLVIMGQHNTVLRETGRLLASAHDAAHVILRQVTGLLPAVARALTLYQGQIRDLMGVCNEDSLTEPQASRATRDLHRAAEVVSDEWMAWLRR